MDDHTARAVKEPMILWTLLKKCFTYLEDLAE
jgi:hypothetical protein